MNTTPADAACRAVTDVMLDLHEVQDTDRLVRTLTTWHRTHGEDGLVDLMIYLAQQVVTAVRGTPYDLSPLAPNLETIVPLTADAELVKSSIVRPTSTDLLTAIENTRTSSVIMTAVAGRSMANLAVEIIHRQNAEVARNVMRDTAATVDTPEMLISSAVMMLINGLATLVEAGG